MAISVRKQPSMSQFQQKIGKSDHKSSDFFPFSSLSRFLSILHYSSPWRRPEIQLAVHLPATGIYPGPKDRADVLGGKRPQRHRGIYLHPFSSSPTSFHLRSFFHQVVDNLAPKPTDVPNISDTVRIVESSGEPDGRFAPRLQEAISQFSSLTLSSSLCYSPRRNRIFPGRDGRSVVGTASSAASTSTCLRRIFRIASPVRHLPSAS